MHSEEPDSFENWYSDFYAIPKWVTAAAIQWEILFNGPDIRVELAPLNKEKFRQF